MKCKRYIAVLLTAWLLCPLPGTARAHEVPDFRQKGTVTVEMTFDDKPVTGGSLSAYRVGQIREDDGSYSFVPSPEMDAFPGDYADITDPKLAEQVAAFVEKETLSPCAKAENKDGKAVFADLELGLYLIVQSKASDGFDPITPFLVSVPMNEDDQYVYEVNAVGKFQLHLAPPAPTTPAQPEGSGSKLPQTGQLNWPIPVLAVMGLLLFSAGWVLRFGTGKDSNEN